MKITELLNAQPTGGDALSPVPPAPVRKLDMASLDLFASQRQKSEDAAPLFQRQLPYADLVAPHRDAAMSPQKTPIVSSPQANDKANEKETPKPKASSRKLRAGKQRRGAKKETAQTADTSPLAALAHAAVKAVKLEDEMAAEETENTTQKDKSKASTSGGRPAPMTDDQKRAKQRMLVKKSYYRKIDTLNTLRETVTQLEHEYSAVVQTSQQKNQPKASLPRHSISALVHASAEGELLQSFQEMAVNIDRLRHENEELRAIAMEQSKARTRVGILAHEEIQDQQKRVTQYGEIIQQIPATLRTPEEDADIERAISSPQISPHDHTQSSPDRFHKKRGSPPVIHMTPMTEDECIEVARDAYTELQQFRKSKDYITSGGQVFGWRDRRRIEGDHVEFAMEKTFQHRTAEQLATNTWRVLSTERGMNRIYSSSLRATYHLVQRVSDHNVVFYRTMERIGQNVLLKTLILASFVQTETGYMILFRSIDPLKRNVRNATPRPSTGLPPGFTLDGMVQPLPERKEVWMDMFSWGVIEPAGPNHEHCTDFFGGFVPATVAANGAFWLMEVLLIALRCESECVGPLFILQDEDNDKEKMEISSETGSSDHDDVVMDDMR